MSFTDKSDANRLGLIHDKSQKKHLELIAILFVFALITCSFSPVLLNDYVPQDQWRAFSYNTNVVGVDKFTECIKQRSQFMVLTGRPLVFLPECFEHAAVEKISDFKSLRIPVFIIVALTAIIFAFVFKKNIGSTWKSLWLSVSLVLSPGYVFMFYQGYTAAGVLASVGLSLAGMSFIWEFFNDSENKNRHSKIKKLIFGIVFFFLALLNYPAFAFVSVPAAYFLVFTSESSFIYKKIKFMIYTYAVFGAACIGYFIFSKIIGQSFFGGAKNLGDYQFAIGGIYEIFLRCIYLFKYLISNDILINFKVNNTIPILTIIAFPLINFSTSENCCISKILKISILFWLGFPVIFLISSVPWLVSQFNGLPMRHVVPLHFMFGFCALLCLIRLSDFWKKNEAFSVFSKALPFAVISVIALREIGINSELVRDSALEVHAIKIAVKQNIDPEDAKFGLHLHIIRPTGYVGHVNFSSGEYMPALTQNPAHVKEMFTMALLEIISFYDAKEISIRDCRLDIDCGRLKPSKHEIVITQSSELEFRQNIFNHPYKIIDLRDAFL